MWAIVRRRKNKKKKKDFLFLIIFEAEQGTRLRPVYSGHRSWGARNINLTPKYCFQPQYSESDEQNKHKFPWCRVKIWLSRAFLVDKVNYTAGANVGHRILVWRHNNGI
jgi:hypothetical protein